MRGIRLINIQAAAAWIVPILLALPSLVSFVAFEWPAFMM